MRQSSAAEQPESHVQKPFSRGRDSNQVKMVNQDTTDKPDSEVSEQLSTQTVNQAVNKNGSSSMPR